MSENEVFKTDSEPEEEGRQMFANKKANIALAIAGAVIIIGIIAACVYAYVL